MQPRCLVPRRPACRSSFSYLLAPAFPAAAGAGGPLQRLPLHLSHRHQLHSLDGEWAPSAATIPTSCMQHECRSSRPLSRLQCMLSPCAETPRAASRSWSPTAAWPRPAANSRRLRRLIPPLPLPLPLHPPAPQIHWRDLKLLLSYRPELQETMAAHVQRALGERITQFPHLWAPALVVGCQCLFCWYGGSELLPQGRCGRHLPPVRSTMGAGRGTGSSHPRKIWQRLLSVFFVCCVCSRLRPSPSPPAPQPPICACPRSALRQCRGLGGLLRVLASCLCTSRMRTGIASLCQRPLASPANPLPLPLPVAARSACQPACSRGSACRRAW